MRGLSLVAASGGHSSSRCAGLSLSRPLVAEHRLQTCRLSRCGSRAQLLRGMWDLPSLSRPLLLRSTGSRRAGSVVVAHGPSCSAACGIFPDQGSNPCPLHWQADSQPLRHQGSPCLCFLSMAYTLSNKELATKPSLFFFFFNIFIGV